MILRTRQVPRRLGARALAIRLLMGTAAAVLPALPAHAALPPSERGLPIIQTLAPDLPDAENQSFGIAADPRGPIYVANGGGVLVYDGARWQLAPVGRGGTAWSVAVGTGGRVGAGGNTDAGASGTGGRAGTGGASDAGSSGDAGGAVLLSDDFESPGVGDRWIADPTLGGACGDWAVLTDGATHVYQEQTSCSSNPIWAAGGDTRWTDMTAQVRVKLITPTSSTRIVLAVRFQDEKNYYVLEYTPDGKIKIRTKVAGSSLDVATNASNARVAVVTGEWNTIGLSVSGPGSASMVTASLNGNPVLTGTATGLDSGGIAIGAQAAIAAFDDVVVTRP